MFVDILNAFCCSPTIGLSNLWREECRKESAAMRQSLLCDPEVAVATAPSSQLEEGASKASQANISYRNTKHRS